MAIEELTGVLNTLSGLDPAVLGDAETVVVANGRVACGFHNRQRHRGPP